MKVVILAGGRGERLKPLTDTTPKPVLPVQGEPFLVHLINKLIKEGHKEFFILTGYLGDKIVQELTGRHFKAELTFIKEDKPLGTAGALKNIETYLDENEFIVVNGDTYHTFDSRELEKIYFNTSCAVVIATINGINAGMSIMGCEVFDYLKVPSNMEKDLYPTMEDYGWVVRYFEMKGEFIDIGTPEGYGKIQKVKLDG